MVELAAEVGVEQALPPRHRPAATWRGTARPASAGAVERRVPVGEQHRQVLRPAEERSPPSPLSTHGDVPAAARGEREVADRDRIADRLVEVPDHPAQDGGDVAGRRPRSRGAPCRLDRRPRGELELVRLVGTEVQRQGRPAAVRPARRRTSAATDATIEESRPPDRNAATGSPTGSRAATASIDAGSNGTNVISVDRRPARGSMSSWMNQRTSRVSPDGEIDVEPMPAGSSCRPATCNAPRARS